MNRRKSPTMSRNGHEGVGAARVVPLTPERFLEKAAKSFVAEDTARCPKCDSTFVVREPAFVHCRYCGKMARIANAPLLDQELFERRSGLRLAS